MAQPEINAEQFWQLLEIVASPESDIDTDVLADALDMIANGSPDDREKGIESLLGEMAKHLPRERDTLDL